MKKLTLLFHLGFGKTGTTFLQKNIFPNIPNAIYLGKITNNFDVMLDESLNKLHAHLFNPQSSTYGHNSRNSKILVTKYAEYISNYVLKKLQENPASESIIISNENFLGYGATNVELNILLIKRIILKLNMLLKPSDVYLQPKFLTIFREQSSFLQSHFAYDYSSIPIKLANINKFIDFGVKNHHNAIFGGLFFDEVLEFLKEMFPENEILFAPYEWLVEQPIFFLEQTIAKLNLIDKNLLNIFSIEPTNVNKASNGGNKVRKATTAIKTLNYLLKFKRLVPTFLHETLKHQNKLLRKRLKPSTKKSVKLNDEQIFKIHELYSSSNANLQKQLNVNLKELGYSLPS